MLTEERNPRTVNIDQLSALDLVTVMNEEDATVAQVVKAALPAVAEAVESIVAALQAGGRLIYVGAGTSGRLGVLDAVECVPTFGIDPGLVVGLIAGGSIALTQAVEGAEDRAEDGRADLQALNLTEHDAVVGLAASGRTPYVLGALEYASQIGALTVGISCNQPAPLLDISTIKIPLPVGPEVITGSTRLKAGTAQKMVLNMLSTAVMVKLGKVYGNWMVDVRVTNAKLQARACRIVSEIAGVTAGEAQALLAQTGNDVKLAVVVALRGVTVEEARALLAGAGGNLRAIIG